MSSQPNCEERIRERFRWAMTELENIFEEPETEYDDEDSEEVIEADQENADETQQERWDAYIEDILCIQMPAWVPEDLTGTYIVQVELSWGGPADGFLVELDRKKRFSRARYYFQDWGDYAERWLNNSQVGLLEQVIGEFVENWIDNNEDDVLEWMQEAYVEKCERCEKSPSDDIAYGDYSSLCEACAEELRRADLDEHVEWLANQMYVLLEKHEPSSDSYSDNYALDEWKEWIFENEYEKYTPEALVKLRLEECGEGDNEDGEAV